MNRRALQILLAASLTLNYMALQRIDQLRCEARGYTYNLFSGKVKCEVVEK